MMRLRAERLRACVFYIYWIHAGQSERRWTVRRFWQVLLLSVLSAAFFCLSGSAWGQATTSLRGVVTDPSGAAIPNATVHLVNSDTSTERTVTTDQQGNYVFTEVVPGNYVLR